MVSLPSLLKFISVVLTSHIFHTKRQMPTFDLFWFFQAPGSLSIHAPWSIRMFVFPYFYHVGWDIECLVLSSRRRWMWNFIFAFCGGVYVWFWLWSVRGSSSLVLSSRRPRSALELFEFICIYISCHEMRYISLQKN